MDKTEADLLITGSWAWVKPGQMLRNTAVAVSGEEIVDIGDIEILSSKYPLARQIGGENRVILPGYISTHTHLFQTFLKGLGQGLPLRTWIQKVTTPAALEMNERDAYLSAAVGLMEAIHSGTTSVMEFSYAFPNLSIFDAILQAYTDLGLRGWLGVSVNDTGEDSGLNPSFIQPLDDCILRLDEIRSKLGHDSNARIKLGITPTSIRGLSKQALNIFSAYASEHQAILSIHLNETSYDDKIAVARFGKRAIPALAELGALTPDFLAVHCVQMTQEDIRLLAEYGVHVSHNPVSNMYLGAGISPVTELRNAGVTVSLGVDGAASNNSQDMLENIKMTVLGQRAAARDVGAFSALDALEMATVEGAKALGMQGQIGELTPGFAADITVVNFNTSKSLPVHNPAATLAFSCGEENIDTMIVAGNVIMEGGVITTVDESALLSEAQDAARKLAYRADIQ